MIVQLSKFALSLLTIALASGCRSSKPRAFRQPPPVADAGVARPITEQGAAVVKSDVVVVDQPIGPAKRPRRPPGPVTHGASIEHRDGLMFVKISGPRELFGGLTQVDGVMPNDHGSARLPDGRWAYWTWISSEKVLDQIRELGLKVEVEQNADQVRKEFERIDAEGGGGSQHRRR